MESCLSLCSSSCRKGVKKSTSSLPRSLTTYRQTGKHENKLSDIVHSWAVYRSYKCTLYSLSLQTKELVFYYLIAMSAMPRAISEYRIGGRYSLLKYPLISYHDTCQQYSWLTFYSLHTISTHRPLSLYWCFDVCLFPEYIEYKPGRSWVKLRISFTWN